MGMTVVPKYTFADAPKPDVLVVPGGGVKGASQDEATLRYVRNVTAKDQHTMSVCNGAFILASAGLLDGLSATTTNGNLRSLERQFPKIKVVRDQRYVDNGKIVTTAGLSAGIDGALHVIAKLYGTGQAQSVALAEEYDWHPEGGYARAALADQEIPDIDTESLGTWSILRNQGDRQSWDIAITGQPKGSSTELMTQIEQALERAKWKKGGTTSPTPTSRHTLWQFVGSDGKPWQGTLTMEGAEGARHAVHVELAIAQVK
jgi:putative intracellular protease/amidase